MSKTKTKMLRTIECKPTSEPLSTWNSETKSYCETGGRIPTYWAAVTDVPCPCGAGMIRWAEAGFVPGWRQCDNCGTHWRAKGTAKAPTLVEQDYPRVCGPFAVEAAEVTR